MGLSFRTPGAVVGMLVIEGSVRADLMETVWSGLANTTAQDGRAGGGSKLGLGSRTPHHTSCLKRPIIVMGRYLNSGGSASSKHTQAE